ncbi:EamA family transporter [Clostridium sp. SYSU_GA19001]|uniref:EamA family transporter n=1 Tax=Clostridium caldaquaticum TaxID=2940653 RepID=UPI002077857F|nr:EamA family transporter [Clostridium caldaquaticum]MCM8710185.1 EamA family transporter [Clostridium caldaquaticum]
MKQNSMYNKKRYLLLHLLVLYYPVISIVAKYASKYDVLTWQFLLIYGLQLFCIGVYAIFWQMVIKGMDLSIAYSTRALVVIYNMFWAYILFEERISFKNIIGSIIILLGIWVVTKDD